MQCFKSLYCLGFPAGFVGYDVNSEDNPGFYGFLKILTPVPKHSTASIPLTYEPVPSQNCSFIDIQPFFLIL